MLLLFGRKLESHLPNLFHLPLEILVPELAEGRHRIPTAIPTRAADYLQSKCEKVTSFLVSLSSLQPLRESLNSISGHQLLQAEPDFSNHFAFCYEAISIRGCAPRLRKHWQALQAQGQVVYFRLFMELRMTFIPVTYWILILTLR